VHSVGDLVRELDGDLLEAGGLEALDVLPPRERARDATDVAAALGPFVRVEVILGDPVATLDTACRSVRLGSGRELAYDKLVLATGWNYDTPDIPGVELGGIYHVKNIRAAMEWDRYLDTVKSAVVVMWLGRSGTGLCKRSASLPATRVSPSPVDCAQGTIDP